MEMFVLELIISVSLLVKALLLHNVIIIKDENVEKTVATVPKT
jgi:hypothetical protein